jgi:glycosyltransferase involved in cell wall biosynthesis
VTETEQIPFLVFADDWGAHPSSCQHIFRRVARCHRTLWVNTVGLRPPRLERADVVRAVGKVSRWVLPAAGGRRQGTAPRTRTTGEDPELDLHVIAPPMVPWMRPAPVRALNRASVQRALRSAGRTLGLRRPVLIATVPNGIDGAGPLGERALVYYCVDDFTRWPGVDGEAARVLEAELLARADLVIATSDKLARTRGFPGRPTVVLPHGVDVAHLGRAAEPGTEPLPGVRNGRPVLGYLGLVDARTDAALLGGVARARPGWDVVLVGPVDHVPAGLRGVANIRVVPAVPYERVPEALAAFDVAVLPYARNALTESINPLKLREYLASGRPVVATTLPEVARFAPHVRLADDVAGFVRACDAALAGPRDQRAERRELLRNESWDARAERFVALCAQAADPASEVRR